MNPKSLLASMFLTCSLPSVLGAAVPAHPAIDFYINPESQKYVEFSIQNLEGKAIVCPLIQVRAKYGTQDGKIYGYRTVTLKKYQVSANDSIIEPEGGRDVIEKLQAINPAAEILDLDVNSLKYECEIVKFNERVMEGPIFMGDVFPVRYFVREDGRTMGFSDYICANHQRGLSIVRAEEISWHKIPGVAEEDWLLKISMHAYYTDVYFYHFKTGRIVRAADPTNIPDIDSMPGNPNYLAQLDVLIAETKRFQQQEGCSGYPGYIEYLTQLALLDNTIAYLEMVRTKF
jgi:hypothetical protein